MGKLNSEQREIVGSNCISASVKNNNRKQVVVYTSSADAGLAVKGQLAAAYPSYKFYKAENRALNTTGQIFLGIFTWGAGNAVQAFSQTWKNFTVDCGSNDAATKLVKEINSCINEQYTGGYNPAGDDYDPAGGTSSGYYQNVGGTSSKAGTTTTYLIIGAAAVAIILLLWDRKRK